MHNLQQFSPTLTAEELIEAIGGETLNGSGFEQDDPERGFDEGQE